MTTQPSHTDSQNCQGCNEPEIYCNCKKSCDCLVEVDDVDMTPSGIQTKYVIRYCSLHDAAKIMRRALDLVRFALAKNVYETGQPGTWATQLDDQLADVIRAAAAPDKYIEVNVMGENSRAIYEALRP
jgi:hypothetical protein